MKFWKIMYIFVLLCGFLLGLGLVLLGGFCAVVTHHSFAAIIGIGFGLFTIVLGILLCFSCGSFLWGKGKNLVFDNSPQAVNTANLLPLKPPAADAVNETPHDQHQK